jgi:hypothetical protein
MLALAGNANGLSTETPAVQVQVYDYANLAPGSLQKVVTLTQEILAGAGVSVQVKICRGNSAVPCETDAGGFRRLVIRVVAGSSKTNDSVLHAPLGQSVANQEGGTYASVFMGRVMDAADEAGFPWDMVLAYAAAHEAGHLLLGSGAHTPRGVMKAHWGCDDYQAMNQRNFHFVREQAHQLAERYGRPLATSSPAKLASAEAAHTVVPGQ